MNSNFYGWSLDIEDWLTLRDTLKKMELEWKSTPLKKSRKDAIPEGCGIYLISGTMPFDLNQDYFNFRTPLYVGISAKNLRRRFLSHCKGELGGVKACKNMATRHLDFLYASVTVRLTTEVSRL